LQSYRWGVGIYESVLAEEAASYAGSVGCWRQLRVPQAALFSYGTCTFSPHTFTSQPLVPLNADSCCH